LKAIIYFHLQKHESGRHLIQDFAEDEFAKQHIVPENGIRKSSFFESLNTRGLEQLQFVFEKLYKQAHSVLPKNFEELGDLVAIDGSLIDAVLSMYWADYRKSSKKAKGHFGFDINRGIPKKVYLTNGNGAKLPFVGRILSPSQTGVMDRGYQSHKDFDLLQQDGKHFIYRIKIKTTRTVVKQKPVVPDSYGFYNSVVLLGTSGINQSEKPVRVVSHKIEGVKYFIATDRHDLSAEQMATAYKLRF